jgi:hypothetical protein
MAYWSLVETCWGLIMALLGLGEVRFGLVEAGLAIIDGVEPE